MKKKYKTVTVTSADAGFYVMLDGQPARTPLGKELSVPHKPLAQAVAQEWREQENTISKDSMPLSQHAFVAIDLIGEKRPQVTADILAYAETDLVCYRAGETPDLLARQAVALDPVIAWAERRFGIMLKVTEGVMPVAQPAGNVELLAVALVGYDDWRLAALSIAVGPLGSLVLSLALIEGHLSAIQAFELSHLEEQFETQAWGEDAEKESKLRGNCETLKSVERFLGML